MSMASFGEKVAWVFLPTAWPRIRRNRLNPLVYRLPLTLSGFWYHGRGEVGGIESGELFCMELPVMDGFVFDVWVNFRKPFPETMIPAEPVAAFHVVGHELWVLDLAVLIDGKQGVLGYLISVGL